MKHTPGPWVIHGTANGARIKAEDFLVVAMPKRADRPYYQKLADARLIAAAPEMYAFLNGLANDLPHSAVTQSVDMRDVRALLARIDGDDDG